MHYRTLELHVHVHACIASMVTTEESESDSMLSTERCGVEGAGERVGEGVETWDKFWW